MKKTYMAPVMESEEFLANEYCQSCVVAECKIHGIDIIKKDKDGEVTDGFTYVDSAAFSDDGFDQLEAGEGMYSIFNPVPKAWYYSGKINGNEGRVVKFIGSPIDYKLHELTEMPTLITKENHKDYKCGPNAS